MKPFIVRGPKDAVILAGGVVEFECRVGGDPPPDVLWRRTAGGGAMPPGRATVLDDRTLRLEAVAPEDEGEYSCEADNAVGSVTASATLTILAPPVLSPRPKDLRIEAGNDAHLECAATGNPKPSVFWTVEGSRKLLYPGATQGRWKVSASSEGKVLLSVRNSVREDTISGLICSAVNPAGSARVRLKVIVTAIEDQPPPIITIGPANQTLPVKSSTTLPCRAAGNPPPMITWYKDGSAIMPNSRVNLTDGALLLHGKL